MRLLGYVDRWSARPGERLSCRVSCSHATFEAGVVRLLRGGPRPGEPSALVHERVEMPGCGTYPGVVQPLVPGSYVEVPAFKPPRRSFTVAVWIRATTPVLGRVQGVLSSWDPERRCGAALYLDPDGRPAFRWSGPSGWERVVTAGAPCAEHWTLLVCSVDATRDRVTLRHGAAETSGPLVEEVQWPDDPRLLFGALAAPPGRIVGALNGRLERPRIFDQVLDDDELAALGRDARTRIPPIGDWDFAAEFGSRRVVDRSRQRADGQTVNSPTRAMTGHLWHGSVLTPALAPEQYGAIHFHADDIDDAAWDESLTLELPDELPSGAYAVRLTAGGDERLIPFFVRPHAPSARVLLLAPTLSYLAYSNRDTMALEPFEMTGRAGTYDRVDPIIHDHPELGWSLYSDHADGSGIAHTSSRRPMLNLEPDHHHWLSGGGGWAFSGDMFIVDWLEAHAIDYDVATDHDLHREGAALLDPYAVVLTGMHPEYPTGAMLDGFEDYLGDGGRVMYLGGNGFYWVTSIPADRPDLLEVRRGHAGTRTSTSEPGEDHHSSTLEPGGLWRHRGRAPQKLFGVGFSAEGGGGGAPYRRTPAGRDPRVDFIFEGVSEDGLIGDHGYNQGAAAGDEIDRADTALGTPAHALVVATSSGLHSDLYQRAVEEIPVMLPGQGGRDCPEVRADLVFFETPSGGAVFSTGSISWVGSLPWAGYDNDVARITANVLGRFLDPTPFRLPSGR